MMTAQQFYTNTLQGASIALRRNVVLAFFVIGVIVFIALRAALHATAKAGKGSSGTASALWGVQTVSLIVTLYCTICGLSNLADARSVEHLLANRSWYSNYKVALDHSVDINDGDIEGNYLHVVDTYISLKTGQIYREDSDGVLASTGEYMNIYDRDNEKFVSLGCYVNKHITYGLERKGETVESILDKIDYDTFWTYQDTEVVEAYLTEL